jgi:RNA recognition motif-containing protein
VKKVVLGQDLNGKSRGYAFVEFEREKDMRSKYYLPSPSPSSSPSPSASLLLSSRGSSSSFLFLPSQDVSFFLPTHPIYPLIFVFFFIAAYKLADGKKIDGKRVLVDIERGRTQPDWHPRRLGGGLGGTRIGGDDVNIKYSGRYVLLPPYYLLTSPLLLFTLPPTL